MPAHLPGFTPSFTQAFVCDAAPTTGRAEAGTTSEEGLSYRKESHGHFSSYLDSKAARDCKEEFVARLKEMSDFALANKSLHHDSVRSDFDTFAKRLGTSHYSSHNEVLYGPAKRAADELCVMLKGPRIDADKRLAAVHNVAEGVRQCAGGSVSHLSDCANFLAQQTGDERQTYLLAKQQVVEARLLEFVQQRYARGYGGYDSWEGHLVNGMRKSLGEELGLPAVHDPLAVTHSEAERDLAMTFVKKGLTPDALANVLAEECHSTIAAALPEANDQWHTWDKNYQEKVGLVLQASIKRYGPMPLDCVVKLDDAFENCQLHHTSEPMACHILKAQQAAGLVDPEFKPKSLAVWKDPDGARNEMQVYGETLVVGSHAGILEPLSTRALLAYDKENALRSLPRSPWVDRAARQVILNDQPAELAQLPPRWLVNPDTKSLFMRKLGDEGAARYRQAHPDFDIANIDEQADRPRSLPGVGAVAPGLVNARLDPMDQLLEQMRRTQAAYRDAPDRERTTH